MADSREAVSTSNPNLREAAARATEATEALNVAAFSMLRSRENVSGSSSGSGMSEAMEQMGQMAEQQGEMARAAAGLLPRAREEAARREVQDLTRRQRQMAEALERMQSNDDVSGAREMTQEARDLARRLETGGLDQETVERQQRLFRRMLDAGRTLRGEETDEEKERQSTTPRDSETRLPPSLKRLLDQDRVKFPTWEELQSLTPAERQFVAEYFRRIAAAPPAGQVP
jgi:hypothetical protein